MDPYVGEIRLFAGNYAPRGWAICDGSLLPIQSNTLLFSVLGAQFGGNGTTNFALPDMRGCAPMHQGEGPGLTPRSFTGKGGDATVILDMTQMPNHTHTAKSVSTATLTTQDPTGAVPAYTGGRGGSSIYSATPSVQMNSVAVGTQGGNQPHNNMQPYVMLNFIIALEGVFPPKQQ